MTLLAIETTAAYCQVALYDGTRMELAEAREARHSRVLFALVEALLDRAGYSLRELSGIAVCNGPGAFTGLRIGVAVAQGLAYSAALPVVPVSSLAALALGAHEACSRSQGMLSVAPQEQGQKLQAQRQDDADMPQVILSTIDARMGQVYCAWYECKDKSLRARAKPRLCEPAAIPALAGAQGGAIAIIAGSGLQYVDAFPDWARSTGLYRIPDLVPGAKAVAKLGLRELRRGAGIDAMALGPLYLRNKVTD